MTHTLFTLATLTAVLTSFAGYASADSLPSASGARQDAVDDMADALSEGIWTQEQAGRIAQTRVAVSSPMPRRLAAVWCELSVYGSEDECNVVRVATPAGSAWVGVLTMWTE